MELDADATLASGEGQEMAAFLRELAATPTIAAGAAGLLAEGSVVDGRLRISSRLGAGGMGVVLLAHHLKLDREVAVKVTGSSSRAGTAAPRLLREARAMARIVHENVVTVYDVGTIGDQVYIAMEYLDGGTARSWVAEHPRSWGDVVSLYVQAGRGLAAAHAAKLIHRDFKPDNVLLGKDGRVRVADFGLVRATETTTGELIVTVPDLERFEALGDSNASLTQTGIAVGTPAYMAPEQHRSRDADEASDQFSFCVSLWEGLYGERPFAGLTPAEIYVSMTSIDPSPPGGTAVPGRIAKILMRGLSVDRSRRFKSMRHLLAELSRNPAQRRRRAAAGIALVGASAGLTWLAARPPQADPCAETAQRLAGIWDQDRAVGIAAAFETAAPGESQAVYERTTRTLDAYAQTWVGEARQACEAARAPDAVPSGSLDLRIACLDRRKAELDALVRLFADPDAAIVFEATSASSKLTPVALCRNVEELRRIDDVRAEDRTAVAAAEQQLVEVKELIDAGQYAQGLEVLESLLPRLEALGYSHLLAEAHLRLALATARTGRFEPASEQARVSLTHAIASGSDRIAFTALRELTYTEGYQSADVDAGREWARQARAWVLRLGDDPRLEAKRLGTLSLVEREQGDFEKATELINTAMSLLDGVEDAELDRLKLWTYLAECQRRAGAAAEALETFERALPMAAIYYGERHPEYGRALINAGAIAFTNGLRADAHAKTEEGIALRRAVLGDEDIVSLQAEVNLGIMLANRGDYEAGERLMRQAIDTAEAAGLEQGHIIPMMANRIAPLRALGRVEEALELAGSALTLSHEQFGPTHPQTLRQALHLASLEHMSGRPERSLALCEEALSQVPAQSGDAIVVGTLAGEAGSALSSMDRCAEAEPYLNQALDTLRPTDHQDFPYLLHPLRILSGCLVELGRPQEALPLIEEARTLPALSAADQETIAAMEALASKALGD